MAKAVPQRIDMSVTSCPVAGHYAMINVVASQPGMSICNSKASYALRGNTLCPIDTATIHISHTDILSKKTCGSKILYKPPWRKFRLSRNLYHLNLAIGPVEYRYLSSRIIILDNKLFSVVVVAFRENHYNVSE